MNPGDGPGHAKRSPWEKGWVWMEIRQLRETEMEEALQLVWEVFCAFEAPVYSAQGVEDSRSRPRTTWVTPMAMSSNTTASW